MCSRTLDTSFVTTYCGAEIWLEEGRYVARFDTDEYSMTAYDDIADCKMEILEHNGML